MRIVAIKNEDADESNTYSSFIEQLLKESFSEHSFRVVLFNDIPSQKKIAPAENTFFLITMPQNTALGFRWWLEIKLPVFLKKFKADKVIYLSGYLSQSVKLPQFIILPDINYLEKHKKNLTQWQKYSAKKLNKFLPKAQSVITYSETARYFFIKKYELNEKKISVIYYSVLPFLQVEKNSIKEKYADNKEYFLLIQERLSEDTLPVLRSFSIFKKWQKSNMQLLIISGRYEDDISFTEKLSSYKYREDVKIINNVTPEIQQKIIASAYAVIHFPRADGNLKNIIATMQCGIPVLTTKNGSILEICGDAALYTEDTNPEIFSKQLIEIFKNEQLRKQLIDKGILQAEKYSYNNSKQQLWDLFIKSGLSPK